MRHSIRNTLKKFVSTSLYSGNLHTLRKIVTFIRQQDLVSANAILSKEDIHLEPEMLESLQIGNFATTCSPSLCCSKIYEYLESSKTNDESVSERIQTAIVLATRACSSGHDVFIWNVIESHCDNNEYVKLLKELYEKEPRPEFVKCAIMVCLNQIKVFEKTDTKKAKNDGLDYLRIVLQFKDRPPINKFMLYKSDELSVKCVNVSDWKISEYRIEIVYTK
jgi:hypothetical protein